MGLDEQLTKTQERKPSRFDYVRYDEPAQNLQATFKADVEILEANIEKLSNGRYKALALTKLEECYMHIGKAIRDDQIARNGSAPLQEERTNS